jgi:hypothetical protein
MDNVPVERRTVVAAGFISGQTLLLFVCLFLALSQVRAHETLGDGDPKDDWIEGLSNGDNALCCGSQDCFPLPVGALQRTSHGYEVEIGGRWFTVPEVSMLRDRSPDGRAWVCPMNVPTGLGYMYTVRGVRCPLLPFGM